jgi:Na+-translocating ferredoxin:NAD+ oxidoreductase RNF subunit RnfB
MVAAVAAAESSTTAVARAVAATLRVIAIPAAADAGCSEVASDCDALAVVAAAASLNLVVSDQHQN